MKTTTMILALFFATSVLAQETYTVNTEESVINWTGEKVIGNSHEGTLKFKSGKLTIEDGELVGGNFVVNMTSLDNSDLSGKMKSKLVGHLKSADFFNVAEHNTSSLTIKNVGKDRNGLAEITADLTIKGNTETVTFPAFMQEKGDNIVASAELIFDRSKFNVRYGSGSFFDNLGDKAIEDEIKIQVNLQASK